MFSFVLFLIFVVQLSPSSPWPIPTGELTPMATAAQIEANRLNVQKSTGPTTLEGKARARLRLGIAGSKAENRRRDPSTPSESDEDSAR